MAPKRKTRMLDAAIAQHYARHQAGLPPPIDPHPGYASFLEAYVARRRWLSEQFPPSNPAPPTPVALPDPPSAE
jgi:hypothetical protein